MTVIHYSNSDTTNPLSFPLQYLNSNHVTYYVITRVIRHSIGSTANNGTYYVRRELDSAHPPEQWYVIITSDVTWTEGQINVPELESKLVVHSSILIMYDI